MRLQFLGAAETTSGSCYLLRFGENNVLVDCGLFQGPEELKQRNYGDFPFLPREIDALILTHAHIDHSGLIPKLVKHGFNGPVYATDVTVDLCAIMLADSGHIQESEVERKNRKLSRRGQKLLTPIYTVEDAAVAMKQFRSMIYDEEVPVLPGLRLRFRDAGHILGAAIVELWVTEGEQTTKLVFSGDLGNMDQPIVQDPTYISEADILIIESTYGTRLHEDREGRLEHLAQVVNDTLARGGNLLIPAFAVGRTQDLLYSFRVLQDQGKIPRLNIYIDSPLASLATEVFAKHAQVFDFETREMLRRGSSPFTAPNIHFTESVQESMRLNNVSGGLVILAGSGMADAGRIKHHLKHNLWRKQASVLFVGYQAQGTLGRLLQDGAEEVRIHGEPVKVAATIETISGFSAHGDQASLLQWLRRFRHLGQIFVTHGEPESCHGFAAILRETLQVPVTVPKLDESFELKTTGALSTWADAYAQFSVDDAFSGAYQVAQGREVVFRGVQGLAQRKYKLANNLYTLFNLGSSREFFAQVALAYLVEQGSVDQSKLPPWSSEQIWEEQIEEVTGKAPWFVVTEQVFNRVQMHQSAYYYLDQTPAAAASGYTRTRGGQVVENVYAILGSGLRPQLFSTLHDLKRFWNAFAGGELVTPETVRTLLAPYEQDPDQFFRLRGSAPGVRVELGGRLDPSLFIAVLSNGEEGVESVFEQLVTLSV